MNVMLARRLVQALNGSDPCTASKASARARMLAIALAILVATSPFVTPAPASADDAPDARNVDAQAVDAQDIEQYYNPFGDRWITNKGPNVSIPVGLTPPCHRKGPHVQLRTLFPEEIAHLTKSSSLIMPAECAELTTNDPKMRAVATDLVARRPNLKIIGYMTPVYGRGSTPVGNQIINRSLESFYVHKRGLPPTRANRAKYKAFDVLDITNPAYRQFLANRVAVTLRRHNLGGVAVDQCHKRPFANNLAEIPPEKIQAWGNGCLDLLARIKRAVGPSKLVFFLGLTDFEFTRARFRLTDGFLWEDPMGPLSISLSSDTESFQRIQQVLAEGARQNKIVGVWVNTNINGPNNRGKFRHTTLALERKFSRYYLAGFLSFFRGPKTPLFYYTPVRLADQFHSETFFRDWNLRIGSAQGQAREVKKGPGGSVFRRTFQQGEVVFNNTSAPYRVNLGRVLLTADGQRVREFTLTPKSGMVFVTPAAFATR